MSPIDPDIESKEKISSQRQREDLVTIMGDTTILDSSEEENQVLDEDLDDVQEKADLTTTTTSSESGDIDSTTSPEMLEDITTTQDQDMGLTHSIDYINY